MFIKKKITEQAAFNLLSTKCATTEYCCNDMRKMMMKWDLPDGADERILKQLQKDRYVDEQRYARAFVHDKFLYNHWGIVRIEQQLKLKGICQDIIDEAKTEIDANDSLKALKLILESKRKTVKGNNDYEINAKLFRFALSRGFSFSDINEVLNTDFEK